MSDNPLRVLLGRFPGMDDEQVNAVLADIALSGKVRAFGYGSLVWRPHYPVDRLTEAVLGGFERGFVVQDPKYRGTPEQPALTLGIDAALGGEVAGAVLEADASHGIGFFQALLDRENPPGLPIYTFRPLAVQQADGTTALALTCIADPNGSLYVGDSLNEAQKGEMIARAMGPNGTARDYLARTVRALDEQGAPCPKLESLLVATDAARARMTPDERARLEAREHHAPAAPPPAVTVVPPRRLMALAR